MNEDNLKPFTSEQSREEAKKNGRKGGIASGKARREKKKMKEQLNLLLSLPVKDEKVIKQLKDIGIEEEDIDYQMAYLISLYKKGLKTGDKSIAEFFRDTTDGKPKEVIEVNKAVDETINEIDDYICQKEK